MQKIPEENLKNLEIPRTTAIVNFAFETPSVPDVSNTSNKSQPENVAAVNLKPIPKTCGKELGATAQEIFKEMSEKKNLDVSRCLEFQSCINAWSEGLTKRVISGFMDRSEERSQKIAEYFAVIETDLEDIQKLERELESIQNQVGSLYQLIKN